MTSDFHFPSDLPPFTSPPAGYLASDSVERLGQAWIAWRKDRQSPVPNLMDFLPAETATRERILTPLAEVHFEYGLEDGQWDRVEAFLERCPDLKSHIEVLMALIGLETRHRRDNGETVTDDEYWRRFPPFAALQVRDDFEKALREGKLPVIEDFLQNPLVPRPLAIQHLVALDLDERLRRREHVRLEEYLTRFPDFFRESDAIADLLLLEYEGRARVESDIPFAEYEKRFPDAYPRLARHLHIPRIDGFTILSQLGRGGMGRVYKAREHRLGGRLVAIKVILASALQQSDALRRFQREAEATAQIEHPNIARVYQVGQYQTEQGDCLPYLVIEYVSGGTLAAAMDAKPQNQRDAAETVECLALAVHAAHQRGIIHRDLKPQNVLLGPEPKITDFGLAKLVDRDSSMTQGQILGTPGYMAPEQVTIKGTDHAISPATDVWALGAILYEALTGRPPFQASEPGGIAGARGGINEEPNTEGTTSVFYRILHDDPVRPRRLEKAIDPHLEAICLKCLEKSPKERFASAEALAQELRRYLNHDKPTIGLVTRRSEFRRWCRRNPVIASAAAIVLLVVTASAIWSNYARIVAVAARLEANNQQRKAEANEAIAKANEQKASHAAKSALEEKQIAELERDRTARTFYTTEIRLANMALSRGAGDLARMHLDASRWDLRGWEYYYLRDQLESNCRLFVPLPTPRQHLIPARCIGLAIDAERVTWVDESFFDHLVTIQVFDKESGRKLEHHKRAKPDDVAFTTVDPHCKTLAFVKKTGDIAVQELLTGEDKRQLTTGAEVFCVAFDPRDARLATGSVDTIKVFDLLRDTSPRELRGYAQPVVSICFSADGKYLLAGYEDGMAKIWDIENGKDVWQLRYHTAGVFHVAWGTRYVATASRHQSLAIWSLPPNWSWSLEEEPCYAASCDFEELGSMIACSPDGGMLAAVDPGDGSLVLHSPIQDVLPVRLYGCPLGNNICASWRIAFSKKSKEVALARPDGSVCLWDVPVNCQPTATDSIKTPIRNGLELRVDNVSPSHAVCISPNGAMAAVVLANQSIRIVDLSSRATIAALPFSPEKIDRIAFSPDGKWFLVELGKTRTATIWNAATWELRAELPEAPIASREFTTDGKWLVALSRPREWGVHARHSFPPRRSLRIDLWNAVTWTRERQLEVVKDLAQSPLHDKENSFTRAQSLVTSVECALGPYGIGPQLLPSVLKHWLGVEGVVSVTSDLKSVLIAAKNPQSVSECQYKVRDTRTGRVTMEFHAMGLERSPNFSHDGRYLAAISPSGTLDVWDMRVHSQHYALQHVVELAEGDTPRTSIEGVQSFSFSPDGSRLVTVSLSQVIVWDVVSGRELLRFPALKREGTVVRETHFTSNGERLVDCIGTIGEGETQYTLDLCVWNAPSWRQSSFLRGHSGRLCDLEISPDGAHIASRSDGADGYIEVALWSVRSGELKWLKRCQYAGAMRFCSIATGLIGVDSQDMVSYDLDTGKSTPIPGIVDFPAGFALMPNGLAASCEAQGEQGRIRNLTSPGKAFEINTDGWTLDNVAASTDGRRLAYVARLKGNEYDPRAPELHSVLICNVSTRRVVHTLQAHDDVVTGIAFSPSGKQLVTSSRDTTVKLWDVDEGELLWTYTGHSDSRVVALDGKTVADAVADALFSPGGKCIALGTGERSVVLLDSATGKEVARLNGHTHAVTCVAFDRSGRRLVSGSVDGTIRLWTLDHLIGGITR